MMSSLLLVLWVGAAVWWPVLDLAGYAQLPWWAAWGPLGCLIIRYGVFDGAPKTES